LSVKATYDKIMTSLGKIYERLKKFTRFFANWAPGSLKDIAL